MVGINTWAGHAPGIVYNRGMEPNPQSLYKQKYGLDVKFVLLEDPAAKLAAFRSEGTPATIFFIGGADGHTEELRAAAGWTWALSRLTLQQNNLEVTYKVLASIKDLTLAKML